MADGRTQVGTAGAGEGTPAALLVAIADELRTDLLPFWRERSVDAERGGFVAEIDGEGRSRPEAAKGLVLNARLLWAFSALYRAFADPRDLDLARRAYAYLERRFRDRRHGGYHWRVAPDGAALPGTKKTYGQAFAIYALSEYHLASRDAGALAAARAVWELLERHARDERHGGYLEACADDWSPTAELRLGDDDPLAPKSMNAHLHVLEAYTALSRAWPAAAVAQRLRELVGLFATRIVDPATHHLRHFFDASWGVLSDTYTYGHDIESVWLLAEAAAALGDAELAREVDARMLKTARVVLAEGVDADGALAYAGRGGVVVGADRDWWCQAEAMVGLWHAFEASGERAFAAAAAGVWRFVERAQVDREHGEWHWRVRADGSVDPRLPKVSEWKCPYHTVRACLEMLRRLDRAAGAGP